MNNVAVFAPDFTFCKQEGANSQNIAYTCKNGYDYRIEKPLSEKRDKWDLYVNGNLVGKKMSFERCKEKCMHMVHASIGRWMAGRKPKSEEEKRLSF